MKYLGSKNKLAKFIIPIITRNINKYNYYIEPFVGGANIIGELPSPKDKGFLSTTTNY